MENQINSEGVKKELTKEYWDSNFSFTRLRDYYRETFGGKPSNMNKEKLIEMIISALSGEEVPQSEHRGRKTKGSNSEKTMIKEQNCSKEIGGSHCGKEKCACAENSRNFGYVSITQNEAEKNTAQIQKNDNKTVCDTSNNCNNVSLQKNNETTTKKYFKPDIFDDTLVCEDPAKEVMPNFIKGTLELHSDGYGFLRGKNYEADSSTDIYVSKNVVRALRLRRGDYIEGLAERMHDNSSPSLKTVIRLNGLPYGTAVNRPFFDDLIPYYPQEKLTMEISDEEGDLSMRCIDILCPIGKGQRGLIVAPPKAGKTTLLKKIAHSVEINHPNVLLIVLLIDERPEEVTDLKRSVKGEVVYSTFDEAPEHHIRAAELVLNRAKRLVENGKDVVILLDSITKLARAYNSVVPSSGKTLSGGIDPIALQAPKKFFGSARNIENGGSLTILSTTLIDTGSKMDDVIYEEFKGTGNMEIHLSRELSERRIFPAIDLYRSGTRKDELLLNEDEQECAYYVRRYLDRSDDAMQNLLDMMKRTSCNVEFVKKVPAWVKLLTEKK